MIEAKYWRESVYEKVALKKRSSGFKGLIK